MSVLSSWLASPPPDAAIEITPGWVSGAVIGGRSGAVTVEAHAIEPLPRDAVVASLTAHNVAAPDVVATAIRQVVQQLGRRVSRVALVLPDPIARVSLVRFDQVPARREDLDQLVRWQVRKGAPFPIEDASVSYTPGSRGADGSTEFVVVAARRDVVREYERLCEAAGVDAGLIDLATLSVTNLHLAAVTVPTGDWMLVHMRPEYTSLVILRGRDVLFFRSRPEGEDVTLADLVHQTAMYYEDRLAGRGFSRVLLGGAGGGAGAQDLTRRSLEERLGVAVEPVNPAAVATVSDRIALTPGRADVLAPLLGMLLRTRDEVAA